MLDRSTWVIQANSPCWSLQRFAPVVCSVCLFYLKGLWTGIWTLKCAYNITMRVEPVTEIGIWCVNDLNLSMTQTSQITWRRSMIFIILSNRLICF